MAPPVPTSSKKVPRSFRCPACQSEDTRVFYEVGEAPVHSVLLLRSRGEALAFPTGRIELSLCAHCGFIFNGTFDGSRMNYSLEYEETQGFSPTFNAFHRRLALDLIHRHDLRGKRIIEIGCGKGDFLNMLCDLGPNTGTGFDPSYRPERDAGAGSGEAVFIQDFYSEKYAHVSADFVCCKMTLEHIPDVFRFVGTVRRSLAQQPDAIVFFQIPEMKRILHELAFWDVYYEHCSYFTEVSLSGLFRRAGFEVLRLWTDYDDQYLMIEARPGRHSQTDEPPAPDMAELLELTARFSAHMDRVRTAWRDQTSRWQQEGRRIVLWGGGSKAVAFLTTLGISDSVQAAVDINPYKRGTFLAGAGCPVVAPDDLPAAPPDVVVIMNPYYRSEIQGSLQERGLYPEIVDSTHFSVEAV